MLNKESKMVLERLGVDKNMLQKHLEFLFITEVDIRLLTRLYKEREKFLPQLVEKFYVYLNHFSGIKDILTNIHAEKHKDVIKNYLEQLLSGNYNSEYIINRNNIGLFNYKNKIEPWMYIEAYGKIVNDLADTVNTVGLNKEDFAKIMAAMFKVMLLDITFSMESYYHEKNFDVKDSDRLYAVISNLNRCIIKANNLDDLYRDLCAILVNEGGFRLVWVGHINRSTKHINSVAMCGEGHDSLTNMRISLDPGLPESHDLVVTAVKEKKVIISSDLTHETIRGPLKDIIVRHGFKSFVSVPIILGQEVISAFNIYSDRSPGITDEELRLLKNISSVVSFAIESINKKQKLEKSALFDHLTSLPNRKFALQELKKLTDSASSEGGKKIALIIMNIDKFEFMNESYGYAKADLLLKETARRLSSIIKVPDILSRIDGNKFMLAAYNISHEETISSVIDKIDSLFTQPIDVDGNKVIISLCKGISIFPDDADNSDELIKIAELSLKEVKKAGSSTAMLYSLDLHQKVVDALRTEKEIHKAFDNREFVLYYQPKINIIENTISGAEALIRWNHPMKGIILPGTFIPILEETGLIVDVGEWVIKELVKQVNLWNAKGMGFKVSFNASSLQLAKNDFAERLISITSDANVDPSLIEVEITESALMKNIASTIGKLTLLKSQGFGISIDDFGTGYSSLSYLQKLPIDVLKIDISFIRNLLISKESVTITQAIIVLAKTLAKKTIAEGVNNKEEIYLLHQLGCDEVQGYYYSKPVPPSLFEKYVEDFNRQTFS